MSNKTLKFGDIIRYNNGREAVVYGATMPRRYAVWADTHYGRGEGCYKNNEVPHMVTAGDYIITGKTDIMDAVKRASFYLLQACKYQEELYVNGRISKSQFVEECRVLSEMYSYFEINIS